MTKKVKLRINLLPIMGLLNRSINTFLTDMGLEPVDLKGRQLAECVTQCFRDCIYSNSNWYKGGGFPEEVLSMLGWTDEGKVAVNEHGLSLTDSLYEKALDPIYIAIVHMLDIYRSKEWDVFTFVVDSSWSLTISYQNDYRILEWERGRGRSQVGGDCVITALTDYYEKTEYL